MHHFHSNQRLRRPGHILRYFTIILESLQTEPKLRRIFDRFCTDQAHNDRALYSTLFVRCSKFSRGKRHRQSCNLNAPSFQCHIHPLTRRKPLRFIFKRGQFISARNLNNGYDLTG